MINGIVIAIVLVCSVIGIKSERDNKEALSLEQGNCMKGIAAILIVIIHVKNALDIGGAFNALSSCGYMFVAIFFFYSGYGITKSSLTKKDYFKKKLPKRFLYLIKIIIITEAIYLMANIVIFGNTYSFVGALRCLVGLNMLNGAMWYIYALIIIFAATFLLSFLRIKGYTKIAIISVAVYVIVSVLRGRQPHEMQSCIAYVIGVFFAEYNSTAEKLYNNDKKALKILLYGFVMILAFSAPYIIRLFTEDYPVVRVVFGSITTTAFILLMLIVLYNFRIQNKLLMFWGALSTEIYLSHPLIIKIVKHIFPDWFAKPNSVVLTIGIILVVISMAAGIKQVEKILTVKR